MWLRSRVPAGKTPLLLSLDETCVLLDAQDRRGNCVRCLSKFKVPHLARARAAVTHVAIVCDRADVQPCLPQYILSNKRVITASLLRTALPHKPAAVQILRGQSGWSTAATMCSVLNCLADELEAWPGLQPIVCLDAAPAHLHRSVALTAKSRGLFLCLVPAKMTGILQVCDVQVFSGYKRFLAERSRDIQSSNAALDRTAPLRALFQACATYLNSRPWGPVFSRLGLLADGAPNLTRDLQQLFPAGLPPIPPDCLSAEDLQSLFPRGFRLHLLDWLPVEGRGPQTFSLQGPCRANPKTC